MHPPFPDLPGVSPQAALSYFGGDFSLYLRFLKRFAEDDTFARLEKALALGDVCAAFMAAHTLKGLSGQLGLTRLSGPAQLLCELLRPKDPAVLPKARALFAEIRPDYDRLTAALKAL